MLGFRKQRLSIGNSFQGKKVQHQLTNNYSEEKKTRPLTLHLLKNMMDLSAAHLAVFLCLFTLQLRVHILLVAASLKSGKIKTGTDGVRC